MAIDSTASSDLNYTGTVHLGTWVNWSRGPVFGATLTLTTSNGNLLISFTAFFVTFVAARFWRITCLGFHRFYSTPEPRDVFHHQRQVILRNSETPETSFWRLAELGWSRRHSGSERRSFLRLLPVLLSSVVCITAFALASVFSSQVSTGISNEVLVDGSNCAIVNPLGGDWGVDQEIMSLISEDRSRRGSDAANYAQHCYSARRSGVPSVFNCNSFVKSTLPFSIDHKAPCPFTDGMCRTNDSNLVMDTGLMDSHEHLGLNSPPGDRILFRQRYTCAPLKTEGYKSGHTGPYENYTRYDYGPAVYGAVDEETVGSLNYTFEAPTIFSQYRRQIDNPQGLAGAYPRLA